MKKSLLKHLPLLGISLMIATVALLLEALFSVYMMHTIDSAIANDQITFKSELIKLVLVTVAVLPINILLAWAKARYRKGAMIGLKKQYLKGVFNKDLAAFHQDHATDYVSAITQDMNTLENNYVLGQYEIGYNILSFVIGLGIIAYVNPWIPLAGLVIGVLVGVLSSLVGQPVRKLQKIRSEKFTHYSAYIHSCLSAFHIIKVNHLTEKALGDFHDKSKVIQDQGYKIDRFNTFIFAIQNAMMNSIMVSIIGFSVYLTIKGNMTFGGIVLVINSMERVLNPLSSMGEWFPKIAGAKVLFEKMDKQLENKFENTATLEKSTFDTHLKFENVSFQYGETQILDTINLTLEKGKKYLVVGPSGGGKSTLLRLLRKYHTPQSGRILMDDCSLEDLKTDSYYKHIANVEQHVFLFEDTLRQNLCLYKNYSEPDIQNAISRSGLDTLIHNLPLGLDTMIYDNGKNLSGGEKSRIAIARGLLQNANILLLDEAFSSLDDKIAREIEQTLLALDGVTVINVTHVLFDDTRDKYHETLHVSQKKVVSKLSA